MQIKIPFRSVSIFPVVALVAAILAIGFGVTSWILKRTQPDKFTGLATAGTYYRILPDFSCQSRRVPQASLEVTENAFTTTSTNPFDCSKATYTLRPEDVIDVSLDHKRIGFNEVIFEKFEKEPNLMESVPKRTELWCQARPEATAPLHLMAIGDMDEWTLEIWRGQKNVDQTIDVYPAVTKLVARKLIGSRLNFQAEGTNLDADLAVTLFGGLLHGHAKIQLDDQLIDQDVVCRSTLKPGLICPLGYIEVPPHESYLAQPVCISKHPLGDVKARSEAQNICRKLGPGFELTREEEWLAATKARRPLEWNQVGRKEWTKDGIETDSESMAFRCVFHPIPETGETIFPLVYTPTNESREGLPIEVGVRFQTKKQGFVKAVRFYRMVADPAGYTIHVWDQSGKALATQATTEPGKIPGWQTVTFAEPVFIEEGKTYTASYYAASGHVSVETGGLKTARSRGLNLTAPAGGGVFMTNGGFPTNSEPETVNYGVDVIFE